MRITRLRIRARSFLVAPLLVVTAAILAPRCSGQFDIFKWVYIPGGGGSSGEIDPDFMYVQNITSGGSDEFFGFATRVPIAGTVHLVLADYCTYDGACQPFAALPVVMIDDDVTVLATCDAHDKPFSFPVSANAVISIGLLPAALGASVSFVDFTFTPDVPYVPWTELGGSLPGGAGTPTLAGQGLLQPGLPTKLTLEQAPGSAATTLVIGLTQIDAPFKGGVLVPSADLIIAGLVTSPLGDLVLLGPWPAGIPAGMSLMFQAWSIDAAGVQGWAASNAVQATAP